MEGRIFIPQFYEREPVKGLKEDPSSEESASSSGNSSGDYIERIERETEFFEEVKDEPDQNHSEAFQENSVVRAIRDFLKKSDVFLVFVFQFVK